MPHSTSSLIFSSLFVVGFTVLTSAARAECPKSTVSILGQNASGPIEVTDVSDAPSDRIAYGTGSSAAYDRVERTVQAIADVYSVETYYYICHATVVERFQLRNASTLPVTIRLSLTETFGTDSAGRTAWMAANAQLTVGDQIVNAAAGNNQYITPFIEITTTVLENEPLEVTYEVGAEGWGNEPFAKMSGHLEFIGLPEGVELVPCDSSLPVRPATWGAVKAMYR
jgi:hypothetical protein